MEYPFITQSQIEFEVEKLLFDYTGKPLGEIKLPIPVEEIVSFQLRYDLDFDDLEEEFGFKDVLGCVHFSREKRADGKNGTIWINSSIEPNSSNKNEGRYFFTLTHEVGHIVHHIPLLLANEREKQKTFDKKKEITIMCRESKKREPQEKQADAFAAALLMPEPLIKRHFEEVANDLKSLVGSTGYEEYVIRELCRRFKVSKQAMEIRLDQLKLWVKYNPAQQKLILTV